MRATSILARACLLVIFLTVGGRLDAQEPEQAPEATQPVPPPRRFPSVTKGAYAVLGARYSPLSRGAVSAGFVVGSYGGCLGLGSGLLVQAEGGTSAGRLSVGVAASDARLVPMFALAAKVSATRTWRNPASTLPGTTYLGIDVDVNLFFAKLTLGHGWRVAGLGKASLFTWGLGVGL